MDSYDHDRGDIAGLEYERQGCIPFKQCKNELEQQCERREHECEQKCEQREHELEQEWQEKLDQCFRTFSSSPKRLFTADVNNNKKRRRATEDDDEEKRRDGVTPGGF